MSNRNKAMMKQITHWLIDGAGSIRGDTKGDPIDRGIRTSPVVSREGNIVTTRSGSKYELIDPKHPYMEDPEYMQRYWNGASPLEAIDMFLATSKELNNE